jgi:coenzyme PQQ synthesis protein D (PqqD)
MKYLRKSAIEHAPMKEETILYDPSAVRFCALNGTAAFVWEQLQTPRSLDELVDDVTRAYRVDDVAAPKQDLGQLLSELVDLTFVTADAESDTASSVVAESDDVARDAGRRVYSPPVARVMDESAVLSSFQITSAGMTWWVA